MTLEEQQDTETTEICSVCGTEITAMHAGYYQLCDHCINDVMEE
ncbi:hypothetical protein [Sulfoacidibacillus thermotolerans]|nr:hypothetical protein [Sulfoacidibacillus thermotolerans]